MKCLHKGLGLELCTICNLNCTHCNRWVDQQNYEMSLAEVEQLLKTLRGKVSFDWVFLFGGEPTIHPRVNEIIQMVSAAEIAPGLTIMTNGIQLERVAASAADKLFDRVRLSVYPDTQGIETKIRRFCERYELGLDVHRKWTMRDTTIHPREEEIEAVFPECYNHLLIYRNWKIYPCFEGGAVASLHGLDHGIPLGVEWWRGYDTPEYRDSLRKDVCIFCSHPVVEEVPWTRGELALVQLDSNDGTTQSADS